MNPFEALCELASSQNWCWRMPCTTCGQMHFHYAFHELASGRSPTDDHWPVQGSLTGSDALKLGLPKLGSPRTYTAEQKSQILPICSEASITYIASRCKFPDWLGYLGLILAYMNGYSNAYQDLSSKWATQLTDLVEDRSSIRTELGNIAQREQGILSLSHLQQCEFYYIAPPSERGQDMQRCKSIMLHLLPMPRDYAVYKHTF